ncbi:MAG TPA: hypothetical protein VFU82_07130 [Gammaproteobacteria bacterium]|nr:hypothetical protein [Gammaproteobacteria bacterium]
MLALAHAKKQDFIFRSDNTLFSNVQEIMRMNEVKFKRDKRKLSRQTRYDLMFFGLQSLAMDYGYDRLSDLQKEKFCLIVAEVCCAFMKHGKIKYSKKDMSYSLHSPFWRIFFNKLDEVKDLGIHIQAAAAVLSEGPMPDVARANQVIHSIHQANDQIDAEIDVVRGIRVATEVMIAKVDSLAEEEYQAAKVVTESADVLRDRVKLRQSQRPTLVSIASGRPTVPGFFARGSGLASLGVFQSPQPASFSPEADLQRGVRFGQSGGAAGPGLRRGGV